MSKITDRIINIKQKLQNVSFEGLLWIVNIFPSLVGITMGGEKMRGLVFFT